MISISEQTPLILEGGGDRGVFTTGVLDCFLDHKLMFPYVIGVSAGGYNAVSYLSKQRGRQKKISLELAFHYKTASLKKWVLTGNLLDDKLLFEDFTEQIIPFDYQTFFDNPSVCELVTTNCLTGEASYFQEKRNKKRFIEITKATGRLPFASPMVMIDDTPMLDGGISDSIPLQRAMHLGFTDHPVVVLTRNKGYRKPPNAYKLAKLFYHKYPKLTQALANRYKMYNKQLELVERLEEEDKITVLRPQKKIHVERINNTAEALSTLYQEGYSLASTLLNT